ncbi:PadR family transcriptional regulator [Pelagibacterium lacus]|uniref:PadR family transcriptional regulator n=1 Tax=Pelagibacterium lacus TaxID=2282655 RepID=A0A369W742_9HYPH|nr:PadR family transcriptional regulator [Pelagibacterium lacus]RDE10514.1 PadR family transcriptional regulator [Pelagibacterium lacus]
MSATRLLVLAVVRAHGRTHGYRVGQDLLGWNADKWAHIKTGSIYHALRQLTKEGLLEECPDAVSDNGPMRNEYELTPGGEAEFNRLIEKALTVPQPKPDSFCAGLVMMSALSRDRVLDYLRRRLATLAEQRSRVDLANHNAHWTGEDALPAHMDALLGFWANHTETSHDWVDALIGKIAGGAYEFADDNPKVFATPGSPMPVRQPNSYDRAG